MKTLTRPKAKPAPLPLRRNAKVMMAPVAELAPDAQKAARRTAAIARAVNARATPRLFANSTYTACGYSGAELKPYTGRPDTAQALNLPSRTGNRLRYPDGRITDLAGNLLSSRSLS